MSSRDSIRTNLLVVDDDPSIARWLEGIVDGRRFHVESVPTVGDALRRIDESPPCVVLLDEILPDGSGLELLKTLRQQHARLPILLLAATRHAHTAIDAIKLGATDCLRKPLEISAVRAAIMAIDVECRVDRSADLPCVDNGMSSSLIGESVVMQRVFKAIGQAACSLQPTFLCGPPGSGKETVARTLHQATHEGGTLSFCYCPAVDRVDSWEEMWDETLARGKPFTLVLQEVSQLSLASQTRLVQRLALSESSREKPVQSTANGTRFRIVATSSAELTPAINSGQFRADLFYALSVHRIDLPPLRERLDDLPLLIRRFLNEGRGCMTREGDSGTRLSPSVLQTLGAYTWPGNLDELSCFVKSCRGPLGGLQWIVPRLEDLRSRQVKKNSRDSTAAHGDQPKIASIDSDSLGTNWQEFVTEQLKVGTQDLYATAIAEAESKFLQLVLHHTQGNQARAARILGITRASLRKKIRSLHLAIG